jgi:hypothetical protein
MAKSKPHADGQQEEQLKQRMRLYAKTYLDKNRDLINARKRAAYRKNREAILEKERLWRISNPELAKERSRKSREKHREKRNARNREYMRLARLADPQKFRRRARESAATNREAARQRSARYYERHKQKALAANNKSQKKRRQTDPAFAIAQRLRSRFASALNAQSAEKLNKTLDLIGCSVAELMSHLEAQFLPGMTWENRSQWHIDHIIPVALFDMRDKDQQNAAFHYTNLRPLWATDNHKKGARPPAPQHLFGFAYAAKIADGMISMRQVGRRKDGTRQHGHD